MIDYFALALGHGLIAIALLRLVLRDGLDADPLIEQMTSDTKANRKAKSVTARNAARRARKADDPATQRQHGDGA
ncbi:MAG: hypothetical protein CVT75_03190 [Alphaproteobacteria bacterium HGW-Alphaproteobacteria-14]|nr:MAG: hypothetical protein CVT75_03190 [Alphaproteobacteria bacterium HGW-Alphaproteobacteria-14]